MLLISLAGDLQKRLLKRSKLCYNVSMELDFEIDKITESIEDSQTGEV